MKLVLKKMNLILFVICSFASFVFEFGAMPLSKETVARDASCTRSCP